MWRKSLAFTAQLESSLKSSIRRANNEDPELLLLFAQNWQFPTIVKSFQKYPARILSETLLQIYVIQSNNILTHLNYDHMTNFSTINRQLVKVTQSFDRKYKFQCLLDLDPRNNSTIDYFIYDSVYNVFYRNDTFIAIENLHFQSIHIVISEPLVAFIRIAYIDPHTNHFNQFLTLPYMLQSEELYEWYKNDV